MTKDEYLDRMHTNSEKLTGLRDELGQLDADSTDLIDFIYGTDDTKDLVVVVQSGEVPEDQREPFRRMLQAFVERVEVGPARRQGPHVDLERVVITPRRLTRPV